MSLDAILTLELLLTVAVIVIIVAGAIYLSLHNRRGQRETSRRFGTGNVPAGTARDEPTDGAVERATSRRTPRREFYKSMGLETSEDMKLRLYSSAEYESELGEKAIPLAPVGSWRHLRPTGCWTKSGTTTRHRKRQACWSYLTETTRWTGSVGRFC
jgi:hypothetical protein